MTDYSQGFGGKFGVQSDRQDKSAAGWDHIEKVDKHESQKGKNKKYLLSVAGFECYCQNVYSFVINRKCRIYLFLLMQSGIFCQFVLLK